MLQRRKRRLTREFEPLPKAEGPQGAGGGASHREKAPRPNPAHQRSRPHGMTGSARAPPRWRPKPGSKRGRGEAQRNGGAVGSAPGRTRVRGEARPALPRPAPATPARPSRSTRPAQAMAPRGRPRPELGVTEFWGSGAAGGGSTAACPRPHGRPPDPALRRDPPDPVLRRQL